MQIGPRAILSAIGWVALTTIFGCSKANPSCAKTSVGCSCRNQTFPLGLGQSPTATCEAPKPSAAGAVSTCCYDLDSAGESSFCRCVSAVCRQHRRSESACSCNTFDNLDETDYRAVAECTRTPKSKCCKSDTDCWCDERRLCNSAEVEVDRCTVQDVHLDVCRAPGPGRANTCSGLKWKKSEKKSGT